jgi:hypothetical protein
MTPSYIHPFRLTVQDRTGTGGAIKQYCKNCKWKMQANEKGKYESQKYLILERRATLDGKKTCLG